jgi:hypothetical protein
VGWVADEVGIEDVVSVVNPWVLSVGIGSTSLRCVVVFVG